MEMAAERSDPVPLDTGVSMDASAPTDDSMVDGRSGDVRSEDGSSGAAPCDGDCGPHGHAHGDHCHCDDGFVERGGCCVPAPPCSGPDDLLEENDTPATATPVDPMGASWEGLRVCPADHDVFRIPLRVGQTVTVRATFVHAQGDVDLYLFAPGTGDLGHARPLARSDGMGDGERIVYTARVTGGHLLLVTGYNGAENRYGLTVAFSGP
jgi:hypothetical protein